MSEDIVGCGIRAKKCSGVQDMVLDLLDGIPSSRMPNHLETAVEKKIKFFDFSIF